MDYNQTYEEHSKSIILNDSDNIIIALDNMKAGQYLKNFDVIIGMYHDQVLTPLKTLFEYDAINITLGLPFDRISPDHGPNEKMIGRNISNPLSLLRAIQFLEKH